jgi:5-formyltetrahydrofolate cyclo-ligase
MLGQDVSRATGLRAAKRAARQVGLSRRRALPGALRHLLSAIAVEHLRLLEPFCLARSVAAFASFGDELDTKPLLRAIIRQGKTLVLPAMVGQGELSLRVVQDLGQLVPGTWGIPEPAEDCPEMPLEDIGLIVTPGVLFSSVGFRVGYGGGYYDRLIRASRLLPVPAPVCCGLGFEAQVLPEVFAGPGDEQLDLLVTDRGVRVFRR